MTLLPYLLAKQLWQNTIGRLCYKNIRLFYVTIKPLLMKAVKASTTQEMFFRLVDDIQGVSYLAKTRSNRSKLFRCLKLTQKNHTDNAKAFVYV